MNIITWNANRVERWTMLWGEPLVTNLLWDVICLQEAGDVRPEWGVPLTDTGPPRNPDMPESTRLRSFSYTPPGFNVPVFISHSEWSGRQKNHLVMVTRAQPSRPFEWGIDQGIRPVLGLKVRLQWVNGLANACLIACTHIIADGRAAAEAVAVAKQLEIVRENEACYGWVLAGDFNCQPNNLVGLPVDVRGAWPPFATHTSGSTIDYVIGSPGAVFNFPWEWQHGAIKSDHWLVFYQQNQGPTVQIL